MRLRIKPGTIALILVFGGIALFLAWPKIQEVRNVEPHKRVMVVYGFSILGEAMNEGIFPEFARLWKSRTREQVVFTSSFSGSGTITNQIIMGAPAVLAILSHEGDALRLKEAGAITSDWRQLPAGGVLNQTPFVILVRKGNPKNLHSFADLARPGVGVIHPDPLTSGGAKWSILAEFVSALKDPASTDPEDQARGKAQLLGIWKNVVGQSPSAAGARTQFENGLGDALITYEQQGLIPRDASSAKVEIVRPARTVLSEHPLVVVDRNIRFKERPLVEAFRDFLFSDEAQRIFVRFGFRSAVNPSLDAGNSSLPPLKDAVKVEQMGGWAAADALVYESIWKGQVLKELGK
ncbi:MAG TPA: substrate-binding domain-containing protein [Candidatus Polarisedimenticolia bacterium]|jgi:sulfate transport system substrate-binding protein|nr:substrate-binding domain-containing protein [Candidatus Polarisedimenticolia bacterium]